MSPPLTVHPSEPAPVSLWQRVNTGLLILAGIATFFSFCVYNMADSAQKRADRFQREGAYTEVEVTRKFITETGGEDSTKMYHVDVQPTGHNGLRYRITVGVLPVIYEDLEPGRRLMAWIIEREAVLDYGPKNAGLWAKRAFAIGIASSVLLVLTFGFKIRDWRRLPSYTATQSRWT